MQQSNLTLAWKYGRSYKTRVEINSEVADNGHHTIQKHSFNFCCLFVRTGWSCGENMSFPHKVKNTCDICVSSLWGNVCVEDDLVGISRFPTRINTLLIPVITRFTASLLCPAIRVGALSNHACLTSVCLSRTSCPIREHRGPGRLKLAQR